MIRSMFIFCLTQRLSKRIERTIAYTTRQFPGTAPLNAYYYVPGETVEEMCQLYNGKAIAGGLPLLSEVAALYDRVGTNRYTNIYMAEFDGMIPKHVIKAGINLTHKYPIRVSRIPLTAPKQFLKMYFGIRHNRREIVADLESKITEWKRAF